MLKVIQPIHVIFWSVFVAGFQPLQYKDPSTLRNSTFAKFSKNPTFLTPRQTQKIEFWIWRSSKIVQWVSVFIEYIKLYMYYFGKCSAELSAVCSTSFFSWSSAYYSHSLLYFFDDVYANGFFSSISRLWNTLNIFLCLIIQMALSLEII